LGNSAVSDVPDYGGAILAQQFELALMAASVLPALEGRSLTEDEIRAVVDAEAEKIESQMWSMPECSDE
jgi:hypothetical protein